MSIAKDFAKNILGFDGGTEFHIKSHKIDGKNMTTVSSSDHIWCQTVLQKPNHQIYNKMGKMTTLMCIRTCFAFGIGQVCLSVIPYQTHKYKLQCRTENICGIFQCIVYVRPFPLYRHRFKEISYSVWGMTDKAFCRQTFTIDFISPSTDSHSHAILSNMPIYSC